MRHISKATSILLWFAVVLSACGPVAAVPATATLPVPTSTPLPSPIALPTSDGPDKGISSYKLRSWAEDDYPRVVERLHELAENEEGQSLEMMLPDYQVAVQSEYLLRFPTSSGRNDVLWEILLNTPKKILVPGVQSDSDLMSTLISDLLANNVALSQLSTELEKHNIQTQDMLTLPNMVGNGQDGYVLLLSMLGIENVVGVFTISHNGKEFHVHKVREWDASEAPALHRNFKIHSLGDTNNNNLPEIVVEIQAWSSDISKKTVDHIEWSTEREVFQSQSFPIFWQTCDAFGEGPCEGDWEFSPLDAASILETRSYWYSRNDCPPVAIQHTFVWDGSQYISDDLEIVSPDKGDSAECYLAWAETAIWLPSSGWVASDFTNGGWENDLAISTVEASLSHWPEHADEIWGPAGRDHFRLQLGIWYDLRNEPDRARAVLQQVINNPYDKSHDFISTLASHYLNRREGLGRAKACDELKNAYFDEFHRTIPDPSPFNNDETMVELWGIVAAKDLYCDSYDMLSVDMKDLHVISQQSVVEWLESNEFVVYQAVPIDLNTDELEDYVVLLDLMDTTYDLWIFLATSTGYRPSFISNMWPDDEQPKINIQSIQLDAGNPIHMVMLDEDLAVFRANPDLSIKTFMEKYGVQSAVVSDSPVSITLDIENDFDGRKMIPYRWDTRLQTFVEQMDNFTLAENTIEKLLYVEQDYEGATRYVDEFLRADSPEPRRAYACGVDLPEGCLYLPAWYEPYFRYLQGIAYVQLGQFEQAKQTYYQLWKDFPENMFGLAASWKLESVNP